MQHSAFAVPDVPAAAVCGNRPDQPPSIPGYQSNVGSDIRARSSNNSGTNHLVFRNRMGQVEDFVRGKLALSRGRLQNGRLALLPPFNGEFISSCHNPQPLYHIDKQRKPATRICGTCPAISEDKTVHGLATSCARR